MGKKIKTAHPGIDARSMASPSLPQAVVYRSTRVFDAA